VKVEHDMSATLLRLGLWTMILALALYVIDETFADQPIGEIISTPLLTQIMLVAGGAIAAGFLLHLFGKGAAVVVKNRCRVCKTPIPHGAIYCRAHLRSILHHEDDKTHSTRPRR
jgi:hypothetical protein